MSNNNDLEQNNPIDDDGAIHQVELTPMDNANGIGSSLPAPDEYAVDAHAAAANNSPPKRKRWMLYGGLVALLLLVLLISVSVGVSQSNRSSGSGSSTSESTSTQNGNTENGNNNPVTEFNNQVSEQDIITFLTGRNVATRSVLLQNGTPQQKAVAWLAESDPGLAALPTNAQDTTLLLSKYAATVIYYSMNGEEWDTRVQFAEEASDVCAWNGFSLAIHGNTPGFETGGLICNQETGLPEHLDLEFNNLSGSIPTEIGLLSTLFLIDLEHNSITGTIPTEICQLTNLGHLWLRSNDLEGTLPNCLGSSLSDSLISLNLQDNPMTGPLPNQLCELTSLQTIVLDRCMFDGTIPSCVGDAWTDMRILSIADNLLTGEVPTQLANLASVTEIYLDGNELEGNPLDTVGAMTALDLVFIEENSFTGAINADTFAALTDMRALDLSENQFTLDGTFPTEILALANLHILDISKNQLAGEFPDTIAQQDTLFFLSVHENELTGAVPESVTNLGGLQHVDFANNDLEGDIPESWFRLTQMFHIFLSENPKLNAGPIPDWTNATQLREISLKNTNREGPIPDLAGFSNLFLLDLDDNALTGTIPESITTLTALRHLILNSNPGLTGSLPEFTISNNLGTVLLDKTDVVGDFNSICQLPTFTGDQPIPTDVIMIADCDENTAITCDCCHCCTKTQPVCSDPLVASLDWTWEFGFNRPVRDFAINATSLKSPTADILAGRR